ncbi:MAG: hypothetical protein JHD15_14400 [Phenylobacterium sp.]|uniref:hypothetical protein n=1 Tax=Phenylobacterium sp. TaxID=1871053 RepID=UPI001A1E2FCF|nr:hypothetical protein [Phenylobacterium sp.]MBJ7411538.1 hypothetical protein [Phenylobacterium sp.]
MRTFQLGIVAMLIIQVMTLSGRASAQPQSAASEPNSKDRTTAERPLTSSEASRESLEGAVTSPLRDANLIKSDIPPVLLQAVANPYSRSGQRSCATLRKEVIDLNQVLGDDFDEPERNERGDDRNGAYGVVASIVSDVIPMRSWIRKLSGAERRDRQVQEAIAAGIARRSYLKGIGQARGCKRPASARTIVTTPPAVKP